jgi:hypothetical protein
VPENVAIMAVNVKVALRTEITKALLAIEGLPEVKTALDILWGAVVGLGPTNHETIYL